MFLALEWQDAYELLMVLRANWPEMLFIVGAFWKVASSIKKHQERLNTRIMELHVSMLEYAADQATWRANFLEETTQWRDGLGLRLNHLDECIDKTRAEVRERKRGWW